MLLNKFEQEINKKKKYNFYTYNCFSSILNILIELNLYKNNDYKKLFKLYNFNKNDDLYLIFKKEFDEINIDNIDDYQIVLILTCYNSSFYNHLILKVNDCFFEIKQNETFTKKDIKHIIINNKSKYFILKKGI